MMKSTNKNVVRCGLDQLCPPCVTTYQKDVRLDYYQSSITGGKVNRQSRRSSAISSSTVVVEEPATKLCRTSDFTPVPDINKDHDFEWFDLDAIPKSLPFYRNNQSLTGHDFNAGLIFTTKQQILNKEAEVNTIVQSIDCLSDSSSIASTDNCITNNANSSNSDSHQDQPKELDILFGWKHDEEDNESVAETPLEKEEREFRERIEELEREIKGNHFSTASQKSFTDIDESNCSNVDDNFLIASIKFFHDIGKVSNQRTAKAA